MGSRSRSATPGPAPASQLRPRPGAARTPARSARRAPPRARGTRAPARLLPCRRVAEDAHAEHVAPSTRVDEMRPMPLRSSSATSAALRRSSSSSSQSKRRRKQSTERDGGDGELERRRLLDPLRACSARSRQRSIAAAKASTPKAQIESQTLNARDVRESWMPRSARLTSSGSGIASCRYAGVISNARRSSAASRTSRQPHSYGWYSHLWGSSVTESAAPIPWSALRPRSVSAANPP